MKIVRKNKTYFLNFKDYKEIEQLDSYINKELDIKAINKTTLAFSVKEDSQTEQIPLDKISKPVDTKKEDIKQKVKAMLSDNQLLFRDKVEGRFELMLDKSDLDVFKEMLLAKEIIPFKQSDKYRKAIYIVNENKATDISKQKEENTDMFKEFLKKRYAVLKTQELADQFSREFFTEFKNNEIKGVKSFEGDFFVINVMLYNSIVKQILSCVLSKNFTIEELSQKTGKECELLKIAIEFLKEEGKIVEKRKNQYTLI